MGKQTPFFLLYFTENDRGEKTTASRLVFHSSTRSQSLSSLRQAAQKYMLAFFLTLCLSHVMLLAAAQASSSGNQTNVLKWQLSATLGGVQFYHAIATCNGKKVVFLKFNNQNPSTVTIAWKEAFTLQQNSEKGEDMPGQKQLTLPPGVLSQLGCADQKQMELLTPRVQQVTPVDRGEIVKFSFKDIKVTK